MNNEQLMKIPFFANINESIFDSLTGLVRREYILAYVEELIKENKPFAMAILDIDNFKNINDSYGHKVGDEILKTLAYEFNNAIELDDAICGRFGGDELIIIYKNDPTYNGVHHFLKDLYTKVLRKKYSALDTEIFITATTGCASYPYDAKDFDDLFNKADKALYRGKSKGRNCFIVYVDSKHKDLKIIKKNSFMAVDVMNYIFKRFEDLGTLEERIKDCIINVCDNFTMTGGFFIGIDNEFVAYSKKTDLSGHERPNVNPESIIDKNGVGIVNNVSNLSVSNPDIFKYCKQYNVKSFIIARMQVFGNNYGYVALTDSNIRRIWQVEDVEILLYIANLVSLFYFYNR